MEKVQTVKGEVDAGELGFTLMHEHIFPTEPELIQNYPEIWGDEDEIQKRAVEQLNDAKAHGVDTIVDLTCIGLGRYIPRIQRVAAETDVNIVAATGIYTWNDLPFFFQIRGPGAVLDGPEMMDDMFVRDIEDGIGDTGVRAGIIKCSTDVLGVTEGINRVLRASARAHRRTGAPISTHTAGAETGLEQQRIFEQEGVDLSRVVIGHQDKGTDPELTKAEQLLQNGSTLGYDAWGMTISLSDEERADRVAELCRRGYADQIVLAHDTWCAWSWTPPAMTSDLIGRELNYNLISDWAIPALADRGVSEQQIRTMTIDNPRRILASISQGGY